MSFTLVKVGIKQFVDFKFTYLKSHEAKAVTIL